MFEKLKNYISEIERIFYKSNKAGEDGKMTSEERSFLNLQNYILHLIY